MTTSTKVNILKGISAGMVHLHKEGIIHRDLSARNILVIFLEISCSEIFFKLNSDMEAVVSDFGFARVVKEDSGKTVSEVGPLRWMSPVNTRKSKKVTVTRKV